MVSLETIQASPPRSNSQPSSPRISFSSEFLDESNFISITPNAERDHEQQRIINNPDFDFLSSNSSNNQTMLTADELFFEGKLLPFWQSKMTLKTTEEQQQEHDTNKEKPTTFNTTTTTTTTTTKDKHSLQQEPRVVPWFVDDDPSPRPPTCTVLWKELLKLKKKRASSTLSPSSSSSSTSSSSSSLGDVAAKEERSIKESNSKEKQHVKRVKKGLERTRSANIRIRPMINVPICSAQVKSTTSALPPLFPLKKGRSVER